MNVKWKHTFSQAKASHLHSMTRQSFHAWKNKIFAGRGPRISLQEVLAVTVGILVGRDGGWPLQTARDACEMLANMPQREFERAFAEGRTFVYVLPGGYLVNRLCSRGDYYDDDLRKLVFKLGRDELECRSQAVDVKSCLERLLELSGGELVEDPPQRQTTIEEVKA